jgi:cytochrome c biogenesis protein CcmG/thiol:disulfide interchange protein DsbE
MNRTRTIVIAVVAVLAALVVAVVVSSGGDGDTTTEAAGDPTATTTVEVADVEVSGEALVTYDKTAAEDPAVGVVAPELDGVGFDGEDVHIGGTGDPTIVVFVAHWCPHCQREVPVLVDWLAGGGLPDGVQLVAVATGTSSKQDNYPPSAWLAEEGLAVPVLVDSKTFDAAFAYGLPVYPYFTVLDAEGRVAMRGSGELDPAALDALVSAAQS